MDAPTADGSTQDAGDQARESQIGEHMTDARSEELKGTTYELFIAGLSVLSIFNLVAATFVPESPLAQVAFIMDGFLSVIFLGDFLMRFFTAESKPGYFFKQLGWMDLLSSLPFPQFKILRLTRIFRAGRLMRKYGVKNMVREFIENRAESALLTLFFFIILVLEFGGYFVYAAESRSADANIQSASDAIWYTFVTITTVGYGDRFPVTDAGRLLGMVIMIAGVGLFGTLTGYLANAFLAPKKPTPAVALEPGAVPTPQTALVEVKQLIATSRRSQEELEAKVAELESLLAAPPPDGSPAPAD